MVNVTTPSWSRPTACRSMLGAVEHKTVGIDLRSIGGSALTADIDVPLDTPRQ